MSRELQNCSHGQGVAGGQGQARVCKHPAASIDQASDNTRSSPKASRAIAPTNRRPLIVYEAEVCCVGQWELGGADGGDARPPEPRPCERPCAEGFSDEVRVETA